MTEAELLEMLRTGRTEESSRIERKPDGFKDREARKVIVAFANSTPDGQEAGVAAHASDPSLGVNAIAGAADFVRFLGDVARLPQSPGHDCSLNVGRIAGGTATNIVAERASVHWEYRASTLDEAAVMRERVAEYVGGEAAGALQVASEVELDVPPFQSHLGEEWIGMLADLGAKLPAIHIAFGSEAGIFERSGIPTVVCGPGSISQAHRPDEWIARAALDDADRFLARLGAWASQSESG